MSNVSSIMSVEFFCYFNHYLIDTDFTKLQFIQMLHVIFWTSVRNRHWGEGLLRTEGKDTCNKNALLFISAVIGGREIPIG